MAKVTIRRLAELRDQQGWAEFVEHWVRREHQDNWELAEIHWLQFAILSLEANEVGRLAGKKAIRAAEVYAHNLLKMLANNGEKCLYCTRRS